MDDLKLIKRHYGEKMMHLCRELFPTLLETPGLLYETLTNCFAESRLLYSDLVKYNLIDDFKKFIYASSDLSEIKRHKTTKTPTELLDEAGYILYECKTEEDIQSFKKYYSKGEELCTFRGGRLNKCYVFFAVKKDVNKIKRNLFKNPKRQDKYGTSVISIQFSKGSVNSVSIKNRYNHTVDNPDSTFSNNLDNIIPGLTDAFENTYKFKTRTNDIDVEFPGYVCVTTGNSNKFYKYNFEDDNIFYCPNNIIIDTYSVQEFDTSRYIVFEHFVLDLQLKMLYQYNCENYIEDSFVRGLEDIDKVEVLKDKNSQTKTIIINDDIKIILNKYNKIVSYTNYHLTKIEDHFLSTCTDIKEINIPNVVNIGDGFLFNAEKLKEINLPNVKKIGDSFIKRNRDIKSIDMPNLITIGDMFLYNNTGIEKINLPKIKEIYDDFLYNNTKLEKISLPSVESIFDNFLYNNENLLEIDLPKVKLIGSTFLISNRRLTSLSLPELVYIDNYALHSNKLLKELNLPKVEKIGDDFLLSNERLEVLDLPMVRQVGKRFIETNEIIKSVNLPNIKLINGNFLEENKKLDTINLPRAERIGDNFIQLNKKIHSVNLPRVISIGNDFLHSNRNLKKLEMINVVNIGDGFLSNNNFLKSITLPNAKKIGDDFLYSNTTLVDYQITEEGTVGDNFLYNHPWLIDNGDSFDFINPEEEKPKVKTK